MRKPDAISVSLLNDILDHGIKETDYTPVPPEYAGQAVTYRAAKKATYESLRCFIKQLVQEAAQGKFPEKQA